MAYTPAGHGCGGTALDRFEPQGEPIHPFDFYELLEVAGATQFPVTVVECPVPEGESDYQRNLQKMGSVVKLGDRLYFLTTTVPYKTKRFNELVQHPL